MKDKKSKELLLLVVIVLLAISVPLQYLIHKEAVVGLPSTEAHEGGEEAGDVQPAEVQTSTIVVTNFGFEVGTREKIWGWSQVGTDQGAVIYKDDNVSRRGFASAAVNTNGASVTDCGWFTKMDELPLSKELVFSGYVKTQVLKGEAYLRLICKGAPQGQDQSQLLASVSTDDLHGDNDWTLASLECFIPPEATDIWIEVGMFGSGRVWFDDLSLEVKERQDTLSVGTNLLKNPNLADGARFWHIFSSTPDPSFNYGDAAPDPLGQPSFLFQCLGATPDEYSGPYQSLSGFYGHSGTLTLSGRMRCEGLSGDASLGLRIFKASGESGLMAANTITGNSGWTEFKATAVLDGTGDDVWLFVTMNGSGSLYISSLSATYEEDQASQ
jgi:hypothetical protein